MAGTDGEAVDYFTVPAGRRVVLESLSANSTSGSTAGTDYATQVKINIRVNGNNREIFVAFLQAGPYPGISLANIPCHLIAEPGDTISIYFDRPSYSVGAQCYCSDTLVGHYVNVP